MRGKSNAGGAYITVLVAFMAVLSLVLVPLTLASISRNTTARYQYFSGLYEMAVAGNEVALFLVRDVARETVRDAHEVGDYFIGIDEHGVTKCMHPHSFFDGSLTDEVRIKVSEAIRMHFGEAREWEIGVQVQNRELADVYFGRTTITEAESGYRVMTSVTKSVGDTMGRAAVVESVLTWRLPGASEGEMINCLDYYVPTMLELMRISN